MSDKPFLLIAADQAKRTEVYCNGLYHVTYVAAPHRHSGVPGEVSLAACDCDTKSVETKPSTDTLNVTREQAEQRLQAEFNVPEATGEPELTNANVEGAMAPVEPPMTHEQFEKL